MACVFYFILDGEDTELSIPILNDIIEADSDFNWASFINSVLESLEAKDTLQQLIEKIKDSNIEDKSLIKSISEINKFEAFTVLLKHMKRIGVNVILVDSDNEMHQLGFPDNTTAGVKDGDIYVLKSDKTSIGTPMHEFMHLVFATMKVSNYKQFKKIISKLANVQRFKDIYLEISTMLEYESLLDLDIMEEAFVRYLAEIVENKTAIDSEFEKIYDDLNRSLIPYIEKTFGIEGSISLIDFLKSPFGDLTKLGSTLFVKRSRFSIGYSDHKNDVILYGKIMDRIKQLMDPTITKEELLILKGECK